MPIANLEARRVLTQADLNLYAELSGDHNPIHVDPRFAAATRFGAIVAHGMLLFSLVRGLLARHYPDRALLSQTLVFAAPAFVDEPLRVILAPSCGDEESPTDITTVIRKPDGRACLEGRCRLARAAAQAQ